MTRPLRLLILGVALGAGLACGGFPSGGGGTGAHDTSSVQTAMLGHWVTTSGATAYYISPTDMVMVDGIKDPDPRVVDMAYTVLRVDEPGSTIVVQTGGAGGLQRELRFQPGREALTHTLVDFTIATDWVYVDGQQTPPPEH